MDQAGHGSAGGGEAGAGAAGDAAGAGAGGAGAAGGDGAAAGAGAAPGNVLATGAGAGAAAPGAAGTGAAAADPNGWLPEKHRVFNADTTLDLEASARKVAEAYGHAEKRLGGGDAPPQTVDGYKVNVPEALADKVKADDLSKDPGFTDFLGKAHTAGLNQKQVDFVVGEFLDRSLKMQAALPALDAAETEATLRQGEGWKSDAEYSAKVQQAFRAGTQYAGADFDGILKDYGNDARIVRMLANVGAELAEDLPASAEAQAQAQESLDALMADSAYTNARDPKHAMQVAKVNAMQARVAGTNSVGTGRTMSFKTG